MKANVFKLTIELGNDAMETNTDVARALTQVVKKIRESRLNDAGSIRDDNGNTVGEWSFEEE
jgi:hypothetical protein